MIAGDLDRDGPTTQFRLRRQKDTREGPLPQPVAQEQPQEHLARRGPGWFRGRPKQRRVFLEQALDVEPEHFREYRLRVITERLEKLPAMIDRLYKQLRK